MRNFSQDLQDHLRSGVTTLCRCWAITRGDGVQFGFTDHDLSLSFDGINFKAETGLSATALNQSTGLSVDNGEAMGALSDASVTDADIEAGRFDGAEVQAWLVNWDAPDQRWMQFRGTLGELRRSGGAFTAELRGLTDALNQPVGRVFQKPCTAVLGDAACRVDLDVPEQRTELQIAAVEDARIFKWGALPGYAAEWFTRGRLDILDGPGAGLWGIIKSDIATPNTRLIELWEPIRAVLAPGVRVRLTAGCDKRFATCQAKFANVINYQGFPDLPGEDWMIAVPKKSGTNSGGSLR